MSGEQALSPETVMDSLLEVSPVGVEDWDERKIGLAIPEQRKLKGSSSAPSVERGVELWTPFEELWTPLEVDKSRVLVVAREEKEADEDVPIMRKEPSKEGRCVLDEIDDREYTDVAEVCPHVVVVDPAKYRFGGSNFAIPFCCGTGEESDMIAEEDLAFGSDGAGEKRRREGRTPEDGGEFSLKGAENAMEES